MIHFEPKFSLYRNLSETSVCFFFGFCLFELVFSVIVLPEILG